MLWTVCRCITTAALQPPPSPPRLCSADKIKDVLVRHEIQAKVALLVTDNAANMLKARCLTIQSVGFQHILEMR